MTLQEIKTNKSSKETHFEQKKCKKEDNDHNEIYQLSSIQIDL